jgi:DNA-binding transcriptional regulator YdaS (Cro superfamily)
MNYITKAVNLIGGQTKTGKLLGGVSQASVWDWMNKYGQTPAKYIRKISELTNGKITIAQLLADHENNHVETGSNRV